MLIIQRLRETLNYRQQTANFRVLPALGVAKTFDQSTQGILERDSRADTAS